MLHDAHRAEHEAREDAVYAAIAKTLERDEADVETDHGDVYEAHIRRAGGTEVEVKVNRRFEVTGVEAHAAHGRP